MLQHVIPERMVRFRLRTVLSLLGIVIAVAVMLEVIWIARHVLTWVVISVFLALALNPLVGWLQRRGLKRRGAAAGAAYFLTIAFIVAISFTFVPTLVSQTNDFVQKLPDYSHDVTHGQGHVILYGFRPQYRGQPNATFNLIWSALAR